ncbi:MAG: radical SAM protein [Holosporaceae bacterium]|nr:radical SAM protein [Holosporaceae bacterium]
MYGEIDVRYDIEIAFPKHIWIELTNICNSRCLFCAHRKMSRKRSEINPNLYKRILQEAAREGVKKIGLFANGEPFISKNLAEYIRLAKNIGIEYVYITTNGTLATKERLIEVIESGLDSIKFSINAGSEETYELVHGISGFNKVKENIRFLYDYRGKTKKIFNIFITFVVTKYTEDELDKFEKEFSVFADGILFVKAERQSCCFSFDEFERFRCKGLNKDVFEDKSSYDKICRYPFMKLLVSCEGYLTPCGNDFQNSLAVADLNKISLKEAWNCDTLKKLRKVHIDGNLDNTLCYNCRNSESRKVEPLCPELWTEFDTDMILDGGETIARVTQYLKKVDIRKNG